jgi:hypothetical protein
MFEFSRQAQYVQSKLPAVLGVDHGIEIKFTDYPIRVSESQPQQRIESYADFNV